ncbi:MAG: hypothetical protein K2Z76_01715 [Mycobacterium gordonae]|nr:hypothetical protein [Mycobacterium gordonae]
MNQYQIDGWHVLQLGLSIGATASAVTAAVWGLWKLGKRWWYSTFGLRKAQAAILDQLACTVSLAYVEDLLGVPRFILGDERFYSLPGGWVGIQYKDDAVNLLSITITDSRLWYSTSGMTLEMIDVKLGYDSFAQANEQFDGERLWIGARHAGYYRHYHFGGAGGGYQQFWLSHNALGAGKFDGVAGRYSSGIYADQDAGGAAPDPSKITANTLTILSPTGSVDDVRERELFGPHIDNLRLIWSERKKHQAQRTSLIARPHY